MPNPGIFVSNIRIAGDLAGIFEHDGQAAYFHLYDLTRPEGSKAVTFVRVVQLPPDLQEKDVGVEWDDEQQTVGLFIRHKLCAAFDAKTARQM